MEPRLIKVAAGIVTRCSDESGASYFITRRHAGQHQGNKWEFPGGKVEKGESPEETLTRELYEEIGIRVKHAVLLTEVKHDYGDKHVHLLFYTVDAFEGEPAGKEGQDSNWVSRHQLTQLDFPDANKAVIALL